MTFIVDSPTRQYPTCVSRVARTRDKNDVEERLGLAHALRGLSAWCTDSLALGRRGGRRRRLKRVLFSCYLMAFRKERERPGRQETGTQCHPQGHTP